MLYSALPHQLKHSAVLLCQNRQFIEGLGKDKAEFPVYFWHTGVALGFNSGMP